jgi:hypothetical protein
VVSLRAKIRVHTHTCKDTYTHTHTHRRALDSALSVCAIIAYAGHDLACTSSAVRFSSRVLCVCLESLYEARYSCRIYICMCLCVCV